MSDTGNFGFGQMFPEDYANDMAVTSFIARQMIAMLDTVKLVQVLAVYGGGVGPAGTVDVLPLVNQVDGNFNPAPPPPGSKSVPHGKVEGIPWSRIQGGANAVICDPQVSDIGYVVCTDRDISNAVARNGMLSGTSLLGIGIDPASWRNFSICDGVYVGGCLNVAPNQYLIFTATGVRLVDSYGNSVAMGPGGITMSDFSGNVIETSSAGVAVTATNFTWNGQVVQVV